MASGNKSKYSMNPAKPPWSALRTALVNSKMQTENNALYQTVDGVIKASEDFQSLINNQLTSIIESLKDDQLPPSTLLGRGSTGSGPVQNIILGDGLEMVENVLNVTSLGDWDFEIVKQSDQDVINNATAQLDLELWFNTLQFQCWAVQMMILYAGNSTAGDYKFDFDFPTVDGWLKFIAQANPAGTILVDTGTQLAAAVALAAPVGLGTDAAFTARMLMLNFMFRVGLDGAFQYKFANNAAAADRVSRTYAGSLIRAKLLSGVPIGNTSGGGEGGGEGQGSNPPTVPFPNDFSVLQAYAAANPTQLANSCQPPEGSGNWDFMNGAVAALQAVSSRYGFNGKRGDVSTPSKDAISYWHGPLPPVFGGRDSYVIDILLKHCTAEVAVQWHNVTTPAAQSAWLPGPIG